MPVEHARSAARIGALSPFPTAGDALAAQAAARGTADGLVFPMSGGKMSFATWDDAATALARSLLDLGLDPGDHIALLAENRIEWPVVQIAASRAGLVLVPLNTHYRQDDLVYTLDQSRSRAIILSPTFRSNRYLDMVAALRPKLDRLGFVITLDGEADGCLSYSRLVTAGTASRRVLPVAEADDVAALLYTSGTTGFPKGTLLSHRSMLGNSFGTAMRLGLRACDRWTSIIPLFHCAGCIMNLLGVLQVGGAYVGVPAFDPVDMFRIIEGEMCTALSGVPTSYVAMLDHPRRTEFNLSSLRTGTCGGADADPAQLRRCAEAFPQPGLCQVYGQTESGTLIACPEATDPARFSTVGFPLPGYEVRITDAEGRELAHGQVGQVEARGAMVMDGYYLGEEATRETVTADGWLKTGDLGSLRPDGRLVMAGGRLRDMIIRGGENIYPVEIENMLATHPAIVESAVFGVPDDYYGEIVAAAVRLRSPLTTAEMTAFLGERIARFKVPAIVYGVETFPLTASGKIRKTELRAMAARAEMAVVP
jgi:acyl-CoA synthetase (AMP-forming)/AMP-acid ligase II